VIFSALGAVCLSFTSASAQAAVCDSGVLINEIMWAGSSVSTADEWIELYNSSDQIVDISGWRIFDDVKAVEMAKIDDGQIDPEGYFLVSNNEKDHEFSGGESVLNIDPDIVNSRVSLSNSNLKISLQKPDHKEPFSQNFETVDIAGDGAKPLAGSSGDQVYSMQRVKYDLSGDQKEAWANSVERKNLDEGAREIATPRAYGKAIISLSLDRDKIPLNKSFNLDFNYEIFDPDGEAEFVQAELLKNQTVVAAKIKEIQDGKTFYFPAENFCPQIKFSLFDQSGEFFSQYFAPICYQLSSQIKMYEIMPHPKNKDWNGDGALNSNDEWIEFVNFGKEDIDLSGWKIQDASGKRFEIPSNKIAAESFMVFFKSESKISLNDSGETLILYDPLGNLQDTLKIPASSTRFDLSYAKWGDSWYWTAKATPGEVNEIRDLSSATDSRYEDLVDSWEKNIITEGTVSDIERSGFSVLVDGNPVFVMSQETNFSFGDKVEILGQVRSGKPPSIIALSVKIKNQNNDEASSQTQPSAILEESVISKVIKTKKTKYIKLPSDNLSKMVLGASYDRFVQSFNLIKLLLSFSGVLSFILVILIYDFSCRK